MEKPPNEEREDSDVQKKEQIIALAKELSENSEEFPFPGIDPDSYLRLKAVDEELPGYVTPIDELIKRFEDEGMKIGLGKNPESGNIYILPSGSDDIENDSISLKDLQIKGITDEKLRELILKNKD